MRVRENLCNFNNLPRALLRTKIDSGPDCCRAHLCCLPDSAKHDLVKFVRISEQFVMIHFHQEWYTMSILPGYCTQDSKGGCHGIAAAFHRKPHDVFRVEIIRVFG